MDKGVVIGSKIVDMNETEPTAAKVARAFRVLDGTEPRPVDLQRSAAAKALFQDVLSADPNNYPALIGLGRCYAYYPREYQDAIQCFWWAADLNPGDPEAFIDLVAHF